MVAAGKNWEWGRAKRSGDAPTPAAQAFGSGQELKLGVLLLNLGGPERPEDVQPFLYNLFADPDIIRLPKLVRWLQAPIASVLAARRYIAASNFESSFCARVCGVMTRTFFFQQIFLVDKPFSNNQGSSKATLLLCQ